MAELSLMQAATLARKSKSTLTRAIKSGRMSAVRRADGTFGLDPAEVLRVFPNETLHNGAFAKNAVAYDVMVHPAQQSEISTLRNDLAKAEQRAAVAEAEKRAAEALADERARALDAAERNLADLRRMLPSPTALQPLSAPIKGFRTWWRFWV